MKNIEVQYIYNVMVICQIVSAVLSKYSPH